MATGQEGYFPISHVEADSAAEAAPGAHQHLPEEGDAAAQAAWLAAVGHLPSPQVVCACVRACARACVVCV